MTFDGKAFGREIVAAVKDHVAGIVAPLLLRMEALEAAASGRAESKQESREALADYFALAVANATEAFEPRLAEIERLAAEFPKQGEKGEPGERGEDGTNGEDGKEGRPGEKGEPGRDGKDAEPEVIASLVQAEVEKAQVVLAGSVSAAVADYLRENPPPAGQEGPPGQAGKDGIGVSGAVINRDGVLVLTLGNGSLRELGPVVGKDGAPGAPGTNGEPGKDGRDGLGFEDMEERIEDDGRTLVRAYSRGDEKKEFRHSLAIVIDRGVWTERQFQKGDGVTWGGSYFIAQCDTKSKPDVNDDWRLAVRRGRDGKKGDEGKNGERGPEGKPGRDGRML